MSRSSEPSGDGDSGRNAPGDPRATRSGATWAALSRLRPLVNRASLHDRLRISSSGSVIARGSATVTNTSRSTTGTTGRLSCAAAVSKSFCSAVGRRTRSPAGTRTPRSSETAGRPAAAPRAPRGPVASSGAAPRGSARPRTSWKRCANEPPSPRRMSHRRMIPIRRDASRRGVQWLSCGRKLGVFCDGASECSVEADWLDVEQRHSGGVGDDRWHGEPFDQWSRDPGVDGCDEPDPQ